MQTELESTHNSDCEGHDRVNVPESAGYVYCQTCRKTYFKMEQHIENQKHPVVVPRGATSDNPVLAGSEGGR